MTPDETMHQTIQAEQLKQAAQAKFDADFRAFMDRLNNELARTGYALVVRPIDPRE